MPVSDIPCKRKKDCYGDPHSTNSNSDICDNAVATPCSDTHKIATMQGPWGVLNEPEPKWWIEPCPFTCHRKQLEHRAGYSTPYSAQSAQYWSPDASPYVEGWVFRTCDGLLADALVRHAASAGKFEVILQPRSRIHNTSYMLVERLHVVLIACMSGRNMGFSLPSGTRPSDILGQEKSRSRSSWPSRTPAVHIFPLGPYAQWSASTSPHHPSSQFRLIRIQISCSTRAAAWPSTKSRVVDSERTERV